MGCSIADAVSPDALEACYDPRGSQCAAGLAVASGLFRRDALLAPYFILTSSKTRSTTQIRI